MPVTEESGWTTTNTCVFHKEKPPRVKTPEKKYHMQVNETRFVRAQNLLTSCHRLWKAGQYTDVNVRVKDQVFPAHQVVLVSLSRCFIPLLDRLNEIYKRDITLTDIEPKHFAALLTYAYTGSLHINKDNVLGVLKTATRLSINAAKLECDRFLADNLDSSKIHEALQISDTFSLTLLQNSVFDYLERNLHGMMTSGDFFKIQPKFVVNFFRRDDLILRRDVVENSVLRLIDTPLRLVEREKLALVSVLRFMDVNKYLKHNELEELLRCIRMIVMSTADITLCLNCFPGLRNEKPVKKCLKLREDCVTFLKHRKKQCGQRLPKEIPKSWLRPRRPPNFRVFEVKNKGIHNGSVALGRINHPEVEIERIDLWVGHINEGSAVICGLKLTFRPHPLAYLYGTKVKPYKIGLCEDLSELEHHTLKLGPGEVINVVEYNEDIGRGSLLHGMSFKTSSGRSLGPYGGCDKVRVHESAFSVNQCYLFDISCEVSESEKVSTLNHLKLWWIELK